MGMFHMPQQIEEGEHYKIEWDSDVDAAIFTWTQFASGETFREGANAAIEYAKQNDFSKMIVDSGGIQAHDNEDQVWIEEEWTPAMIDAGVDVFATVHNDSVIAEMDVTNMMEEMEDLPHDTFVTADFEEAREWIADQ